MTVGWKGSRAIERGKGGETAYMPPGPVSQGGLGETGVNPNCLAKEGWGGGYETPLNEKHTVGRCADLLTPRYPTLNEQLGGEMGSKSLGSSSSYFLGIKIRPSQGDEAKPQKHH